MELALRQNWSQNMRLRVISVEFVYRQHWEQMNLPREIVRGKETWAQLGAWGTRTIKRPRQRKTSWQRWLKSGLRDMGEKPWETLGRRELNKQWSETSRATEKTGLKSKFGGYGCLVGAVEDEVRKWRYFVKSIFSRNLSVKEKEMGPQQKVAIKYLGLFFFLNICLCGEVACSKVHIAQILEPDSALKS